MDFACVTLVVGFVFSASSTKRRLEASGNRRPDMADVTVVGGDDRISVFSFIHNGTLDSGLAKQNPFRQVCLSLIRGVKFRLATRVAWVSVSSRTLFETGQPIVVLVDRLWRFRMFEPVVGLAAI